MEESKNMATYEAKESLQIFEEYQKKFAETIEHEKQRVRELAEQESADIIAQAEQKAKATAEKIVNQAERESASIGARSKELAVQIVGEVEQAAETMTQVKQQLEQEIEKAKERLMQETATIAEVISKAEKAITEVGSKINGEIEESLQVVTDLRQKLDEVAGTIEQMGGKENVEQTEAVTSDSASSPVSDDEPLMGTLELQVTPRGHTHSFERLEKALCRIPGVQILMRSSPNKEKDGLTIFIAKPTPLFSILKQKMVVESIVKDNKGIQVVLNDGDGWRG